MTLRVHEVRACPGCGSDRSRPVPLGDPPLRRCRRCHLVYAPRVADPDDVYTDEYLFGESQFGLDTTHPLFQRYLARAAGVRMGLIERETTPGTILDVGCGTGEVLAVARDRGWRVCGLEPVVKSAEFARARGLDVRAATLEGSGLPERTFDVVSAFHVLEHMEDGVSFLRLLARWVRPGGLIVVEVPNWRSLHRRNAGAAWSGLRPLEHAAHYGPRPLTAALRRAGTQPVRVTTPGFLWEVQTLDQQLEDLGLYRWKGRLDRLGRVGDHDGTPALLARPTTQRVLLALQAAYARAGLGQVVMGIARVP